MKSKKWRLNSREVKAIVKNALIFLSPVAITELLLAQQGITEVRQYVIALQVWGIGVAIDFFRKLKAEK